MHERRHRLYDFPPMPALEFMQAEVDAYKAQGRAAGLARQAELRALEAQGYYYQSWHCPLYFFLLIYIANESKDSLSYHFFMIHKYPKHFYDEKRIEIAISQIKHDLRKLFPSLNTKEWEKVDRDIEGWFGGEDYELEPVHDFWNFFGGFSRELKLKSLIFWITASNVDWTKQRVKVLDIVITWDFPGLEFMGKAPYKASDVIREMNKPDKAAIKKKLREDSTFRSERYMPRDQFPIILFRDPGGIINSYPGYQILEGNRRTVKAIVFDEKEVLAYVGHFKNSDDKWPENYWLRTGLLRDLIFMAIGYDKEGDDKAFYFVRNFYQLLLRDFDLARIATIDKSFKNFETNQRLRDELLMEDMK